MLCIRVLGAEPPDSISADPGSAAEQEAPSDGNVSNEQMLCCTSLLWLQPLRQQLDFLSRSSHELQMLLLQGCDGVCGLGDQPSLRSVCGQVIRWLPSNNKDAAQ